MDTLNGLPLVAPRITPVLDPAFRPAVLAVRAFNADVAAAGGGVPVRLAIEQADGSVFRYDIAVLPASHPRAAGNAAFVERFVKFLLWSRGVSQPWSRSAGWCRTCTPPRSRSVKKPAK